METRLRNRSEPPQMHVAASSMSMPFVVILALLLFLCAVKRRGRRRMFRMLRRTCRMPSVAPVGVSIDLEEAEFQSALLKRHL